LEIVNATVTEPSTDRPAGEVVGIDEADGILVQTGNDVLSVRRAAYDGSPRLAGRELATTNWLNVGDILGADSDFPVDFVYTGARGSNGEFDLFPETNVAVGETVSNHAYCFSPQTSQEIRIEASVEGERLFEQTVVADGHTLVPVEFRPNEEGEHYVRLEFNTGDTRSFYVYAHTGQEA
jgi:hypothetical protein